MQITNHILQQARQVASPNCGDRPDENDISLLVIHNISLPPGEFGGPYIDDLFCNRLDCTVHPFFEEISSLQVSSHLLIDRAGNITQYVPFNRKAHHAGQSQFNGRLQCNDFSIGIELEGTDHEAFTDQQYAVLAEVTCALLARYPGITPERITGHSDIAPGRKTDPGPCFDWSKYRKMIAG